MKAGSHYTPETKSKLNESTGTKLYFDLQAYVLDAGGSTVKQKLSYSEFKAMLDKGERFYISSSPSPAGTNPATGEPIPAQTEADITWTSEKLEKYITEDLVTRYFELRAFDELVNDTPVSVHFFEKQYNADEDKYVDIEQTLEAQTVSTILNAFDTQMAVFYSDKAMTKILTRVELAALTKDTVIWKKDKTFKMFQIQGENVVPQQDSTIQQILTHLSMQNAPDYAGLKDLYYSDQACTKALTTEAQFKALEDGSSLYFKVQ